MRIEYFVKFDDESVDEAIGAHLIPFSMLESAVQAGEEGNEGHRYSILRRTGNLIEEVQ